MRTHQETTDRRRHERGTVAPQRLRGEMAAAGAGEVCEFEASLRPQEREPPNAVSTRETDPVWIDTDYDGIIFDWHPAGPALMGYSARYLKERNLALAFITNRPQRDLLRRAMEVPVEFNGVIRPRDQRGVRIRCRIAPAPDDSPLSPSLRWTFTSFAA